MGNLNFLEKSISPNIAYATHQCAHFSQDPRASHGDTIIHLVKYLKDTRMQGIMLYPKGRKSFEVYAGAKFSGKWHGPTVGNNPSTAKSQTGYAILYAGFLIIWCSKTQTQIALSTTKADYIALSQLLCNAIPMM